MQPPSHPSIHPPNPSIQKPLQHHPCQSTPTLSPRRPEVLHPLVGHGHRALGPLQALRGAQSNRVQSAYCLHPRVDVHEMVGPCGPQKAPFYYRTSYSVLCYTSFALCLMFRHGVDSNQPELELALEFKCHSSAQLGKTLSPIVKPKSSPEVSQSHRSSENRLT